jgi:hypothetical protein
VTFNEKIQYRKLYDADLRFHKLADKVRVKEHVRTTIGAHFVIPTLWTGKRLPPIEERSWPIPFVIKANHGCSWNKFVRSEADKDWACIDQVCEQWLNSLFSCESWYMKIEPQILVEPLLGDAQGSLIDYKFFVFGGRAEFIQVDTNRVTDQQIFFYDRNWRRQPFWVWRRQPFWLDNYPLETREIERPRHFTEMLEVAEKLGSEFNFVRVDLYDLDSGPKFGELTFAPASGFERFHPVKYDRVLGSFWR